MADTQFSKSCASRRLGSSPSRATRNSQSLKDWARTGRAYDTKPATSGISINSNALASKPKQEGAVPSSRAKIPNLTKCLSSNGSVAQLVSALPCHGRGRRFKSGQSRIIDN